MESLPSLSDATIAGTGLQTSERRRPPLRTMDKDKDRDKDKNKGAESCNTNLNSNAREKSERPQKENHSMKDSLETQEMIPDSVDIETSSSSEGEDMALLEEVTRIKAQLEAKLREKQLRKKAKGKSANSLQGQATETIIHGEVLSQDNDSGNGHDLTLTPKRSKPQPQLDSTPKRNSSRIVGEDDGQTEHDADMTTPTKRPSPLVSPGFRTPSPPSRRFFMSPPSGASSRKRQHSPSPLPRKPSLPLSQRSLVEGQSAGTPGKRLLVFKTTNSPSIKGNADLFQDLFDGDLDDDFLDALLDVEEPEKFALDSSTVQDVDAQSIPTEAKEDKFAGDTPSRTLKSASGSAVAKPTLTEVVEAQKQRREAEQNKHPKATFLTLANSSVSLSSGELAQLGHSPDFDPITGLRIKDRTTSCEDMAKMTRGLRNIPIKDGDKIRENATQRSSSGILRPSTADTALTGRLSSASNKPTDIESGSWIVAGVVGAKSKQRMTAKKIKYCHFQLCDLQSSLINVFMFREVMTRHHDKIRIGDVVAIMDPKVLHQAERSGALGVQVEHPDCLLIVGTSTDFGLCETIKLNGEKCGRILDKRGSAHCNYHIMMATNKRRNQRGSLIAGTSSIYDLEKPPPQTSHAPMPRKIGGAPQSSHSSERLRMMAKSTRETTYIFDDGGVGTSSLMDPKGHRKNPQQPDDGLSAFLMNQNNPGGQYLRQAKASKDVKWAKDVTSPKTPTNNTELFPPEMIRRMGYDPVSGQFVPGSPKRMNDDLQARERSIKLLTERVKTPPAPMRPLADMLPLDRKRTIEVKGTTRPIAQPRSKQTALARGGKEVQGDVFFGSQQSRPSTAVSGAPPKKWVNLGDGSSESGGDSDGQGGSLLSLSRQRAKNLMEIRTTHSRPKSTALSKSDSEVNNVVQPPLPEALTAKRKLALESSTGDLSLPKTSAASQKPLETKLRPDDGSGANTQPHAPLASSILPSNSQDKKKQRFIDFSDSE
ncbi:hypothetical protein BGX27_005888 [Mortierella sp. AM989]|nr:hypothetical protein BGX27_005888 [Mortierella sp. AM989]